MIPELFTRALLWLSQELKIPRQQVVIKVLGWLDDAENPEGPSEFVEILLKLLGLQDHERLEAEELLCRILARGITRPRPQRRWQGKIARQTDWAATAVGHRTGKSGQYLGITHTPAPDRETISALATLGATWAEELRLAAALTNIDEFNVRRARLNDALARLSLDIVPRSSPMTEPVLIRLEYLEDGADLANRLQQIFLHRLKPLTEEDTRMLEWLFESRGNGQNLNHAYLLEVVSAVAILRTLVALGWKLEPGAFEVLRQQNQTTLRVAMGFVLRNRTGWRLSISKDIPSVEEDATYASKCALFGESTQAYQPDILLKFSGPAGEGFWIVGDAKYSENKDGTYPRVGFDALLKYLLAFAAKIGLKVSETGLSQHVVNGFQMPAGLLFTNASLGKRSDMGDSFNLVEGFSLEDLQAPFTGQGNGDAGETRRLHKILEGISNALNFHNT